MRRCALLLLLSASMACRSWQAEAVPAPGPAEVTLGERVRVTRVDGSRLELTDARVRRDTLRGALRGGQAAGAQTVVLPLDRVRQIETRRVSVSRTIWLGVGVLGAVFLAMSYAEAEERSR